MKVQLILGAIACVCAFGAQAQYKYIGPDGRVVYSDQPPPAAAKSVEKKAPGTTQSASGGDVNYTLGQAIKNFPVILYTAPNCGAPCNDGRALLVKRGVPFSEKTVTSPDDIAAFRKAVNAETLPVMTVGNNKQVQFQADAWNGALTTAGYPATSQLPPAYQNPAPVALSQGQPAAATGAQTAQSAPAAPTVPSANQAPATPAAPADRPAWFKGF